MNEALGSRPPVTLTPSRSRRILVALVLMSAVPSMGASYRSEHFAVEAPTKSVAKQVAETAEECRQRIAAQWLGKRGAAWDDVCTVEVHVDTARKFGASRFSVGSNAQLSKAHISVRGSLEEILTRVLPHEVTHAVLMLHFGKPIPRWADEGAAVLAEDLRKRQEYDRLMLAIADRPGHAYSVAYLFQSRSYPEDLDVFYPQSYSVTHYLVELKGRRAFLAFLGYGMETDWNTAVKAYYGFKDVDALQRAWLKHLDVVRARVKAREVIADLAVALPDFTSRWWVTRSWIALAAPTTHEERIAMPR